MTRWSFRWIALLLSVLLTACATKPPAKLAVTQVDKGVLIWLPDNVLFGFGQAELSPDADEYLSLVARLTNEKTDKSLSLEGHTDNVGDAGYNLQLSEKRARSVADALMRYGVISERLQTKGYGLTKPLAPNDTEIGRQLNRRVEIIVLNETVENLKRGEPANRFEDAFERLKSLLGEQIETQGFK